MRVNALALDDCACVCAMGNKGGLASPEKEARPVLAGWQGLVEGIGQADQSVVMVIGESLKRLKCAKKAIRHTDPKISA